MKRRQISPAALPAIGQPFAGGFYAGRIYFDGAEYALIDLATLQCYPPVNPKLNWDWEDRP